jgi:hypothetical protein
MSAEPKPASEPGDGAPACDWTSATSSPVVRHTPDTRWTAWLVMPDGEKVEVPVTVGDDGRFLVTLPGARAATPFFDLPRAADAAAEIVVSGEGEAIRLEVPRG